MMIDFSTVGWFIVAVVFVFSVDILSGNDTGGVDKGMISFVFSGSFIVVVNIPAAETIVPLPSTVSVFVDEDERDDGIFPEWDPRVSKPALWSNSLSSLGRGRFFPNPPNPKFTDTEKLFFIVFVGGLLLVELLLLLLLSLFVVVMEAEEEDIIYNYTTTDTIG